MALLDFLQKGKKKETELTPFLPKDIYEAAKLDFADIIAPSALKITPREMNLGDKLARTFYVISYPRFLSESWFSPIINLDKVFDVSIYIHPIDTAAVLRKFQKKVAEIQSQVITREEKGLVRDPILDTAYRDIEELRDKLQQAQERIFDVGLYITIYGEDSEELDKAESEIRSILDAKLVYVKPALFQQEQGFKSVIPTGKDILDVHSKLNSSPLSSLFPFISFDLTSDRGILYGINRHNASLILFDRFSLENYNSVTFAKSGSGKSTKWSEYVLTKKDGKVTRTQIGPLVDQLIKKHGVTYRDDELEGVCDPGIEVYSYGSDMKGEWSRVTIAARKDAPDTEYTFTTKSGREITTTADHNMLVLRDGNIVVAKSDEVQEGEVVPLPRHVSVSDTPIRSLDVRKLVPQMHHNTRKVLPDTLPVSPALGGLLGWIASEGTVTNTRVIVSGTDAEAQRNIAEAFHTLGLNAKVTERDIYCDSAMLASFIRAIGGGGHSATKRAPDFLFNAPREVIAAFLSAYFEGDGGMDGPAALTAMSKSRELISDLSYLCYYFGIIARVHKRQKRYAATGRLRTFWNLSISGQENLRRFRDTIGFISKRKRALLEAACTKQGNTNVDIVPGLKSLADELARLFDSQISDLADFSALKQGHNLSPGRLKRLTDAISERVDRFRDMEPTIRALCDLPTIEAVVLQAEKDRALNRALIETLGSSWFTVKAGMPPRVNNALRIFAAAGVSAPDSSVKLKTMVAEGIHNTGVHAQNISPYLSLTLRGGRDNSSYAMLRSAASFIADEYARVSAHLPRIEEIVRTLKTLAESDLFWDPIVSIKKKGSTDRYVYDLTVDNEVFLAGTNGMFVHNSYATKLEILRSLMFDTDVIVIDPESEYEYLANAVGGRLFNISLSSEHHINPFDLPPPREDEAPADILRSNIVTLVGLFRIMLGGLSPEEDAIIDRAITETYALKDITGQADFTNMEPPLLSDFELVLAGMEGSESLVQRLSKYTKGTWAGFINRPTNVDINKKFVAFSVRDMEDELKPVAMYIVTHFIWNSVRKELKKRLLVVDEAWWMMKSEDTASFLYSMAKRGRKYYLGLATITQDVADFLKSPYGLPMISNSSIQLLLKQSPSVIDEVQKTFNLTDEEKFLLLESDVGEGIFFAGLKHVAIKIIASYTEDQIITSDPSQLLAIKRQRTAE